MSKQIFKNKVTDKLFTYNSYIYIYIYIYIKKDLVLNNLQRLISHKPRTYIILVSIHVEKYCFSSISPQACFISSSLFRPSVTFLFLSFFLSLSIYQSIYIYIYIHICIDLFILCQVSLSLNISLSFSTPLSLYIYICFHLPSFHLTNFYT